MKPNKYRFYRRVFGLALMILQFVVLILKIFILLKSY